MGIFSSIGSAIGANSAGKSLPYRPLGTKEYDKLRLEDIRGLYSADPFHRQGLGYSPAEMEGKFAEGRDLSAGVAAAEKQRLGDVFRSSGGFGTRSGLYTRALQRSNLAEASRANELRRRMIVENAQQSRADAAARLASVGGAFQDAVELWNRRMGVKRSLAQQKATAVGQAVDDTISAVATGGASLAMG